jgi:hypothetical protein
MVRDASLEVDGWPGLVSVEWNNDPLSHSAKARISHVAKESFERCTDWLSSGRTWMW